MGELRAIEFVGRLIDQGKLPRGIGPGKYRRINMHRIALDGLRQAARHRRPASTPTTISSKCCATTASARRGASSTQHFDDIGVRGTVDLQAEVEGRMGVIHFSAMTTHCCSAEIGNDAARNRGRRHHHARRRRHRQRRQPLAAGRRRRRRRHPPRRRAGTARGMPRRSAAATPARPRSPAATGSRPSTSSTRSGRCGAAAARTRRRCWPAAIARALDLAAAHGLASIAYPAISTGVYRFPADLAARIAVGTVASEIAGAPRGIARVVFCCFAPDSAEHHKEAFAELGLA